MTEDATPFALVVRFTVRPGAEADFDNLIAQTTAEIRDQEPGTPVYSEVDFLALADGKTPAVGRAAVSRG